MPKPASGHPLWEAMAVKLSPQLMADVRRYADLHRLSLSEVMRQGLLLRLGVTSAQDGQEYNGYTPPVEPDAFTALRTEVREAMQAQTARLDALLQALHPTPQPRQPAWMVADSQTAADVAAERPDAPAVLAPSQEQGSYTVIPKQSPPASEDRLPQRAPLPHAPASMKPPRRKMQAAVGQAVAQRTNRFRLVDIAKDLGVGSNVVKPPLASLVQAGRLRVAVEGKQKWYTRVP